MKETEYTTAVARIRMNENRLLTPEQIRQLAATESVEQARRLLDEWHLDEQDETQQTWALIREIAPDVSEFDFLLVRHDFHNLKTILKALFGEKDPSPMLLHPSVVPVQELEQAVRQKRYTALPEYMRRPAQRAYALLAETGDGQLSDALLDRAMIETVERLSARNANRFISGLGSLLAAIYNMRVAVRCVRLKKPAAFIEEALAVCSTLRKSSLAAAAVESEEALADYLAATPYDDAARALRHSVAAFERWCDQKLIDYCDSAKYVSFGPAPLAAYILRRQAQSQTVRIILSCKRAGFSPEQTLERIRQTA